MRFTGKETIAITGISLGYFLVIFDAGVLNLALPSIRADFGAALSDVQWVLDAYSLPLAGLLMLAGHLGDRHGHRRLLVIGVAVFTAASALAALAPTLMWLIAARALEGVGGAVMLPATLAVIPHAFRDGLRDRATVVWVGTGAAAMAMAPVLGGVLLSGWGWRSVFVVNVPLGVASIFLVIVGMRETPSIESARLNLGVQSLLLVMLGGLAAGAVLLGDRSAPTLLGPMLIAMGIVAAVWFAVANSRSGNPLIPRGYFRDYPRTAAIVSAGGMGFSFYGAFLALSILFRSAGETALHAGIMLLPMTVASVAGPVFAYRLVARRLGPASILAAGFAMTAVGAGILTASGRAPYAVAFGGMVIVGVMSTLCFSALTSLLLSRTEKSQSGLGSGVQNTMRQAGSLLAYSVVGAILAHGDFTLALSIVAATCVFCALVSARASHQLTHA